ncbi:MAG: polyprenyl synthetase family protein [Lachnospiraceae bacterium]|nr:polyprenyl synthetase family protein [Lachnospiraceae bacterium]
MMNLLQIPQELELRLKDTMQRGDAYDGKLWEAMEYSLLAGGKRVRPCLLMLTGQSLGAEPEILWPFAMALEMIHTYSLIHDDLPAMDNDDYRRGRLTNHKVFGEGTAILAGDGLLTLAFEIMGEAICRSGRQGDLETLKRQALCQAYMAYCAGTKGMIAGQMADLASENRQIRLEELQYIEFNKTSRLLMAAMVGGALLAGKGLPETDAETAALERAAGKIGETFQIVDDILDVESSLEELGKMPGSDDKAHKATFVSLYGLEKARETAAAMTEEALKDMEFLPGEAGEELRRLALSMVDRKK